METQHEPDVPAATHLLHRYHDNGDDWRDEQGTCCFCLHEGSGAAVDDAVSQKYFSDDPLMQSSTGHVCEACAYCMSTRTLKQGHWVAHADGLIQPSTGDLLHTFRNLRAGEFDTPFAVHVTSSPIRSSHAYLWTPLNATDSPLTVAYDRQKVRIADWKQFSELVSAVEDLRLHGFTFDEIRTGEPRVRNLREIGRESYQGYDEVVDSHRRTARLELALALSRAADDQPRTDLTESHDPLA
jgi:hypothetical protein